MQPAQLYTCPNCGGPVSGGALQCDHCSAPLATVRCARCYHMNPPHNVHCAGCGSELGLEPIGQPVAVTCPKCAVALDGFRGGPGMLYDCSGCGGQFVEHALLHDLLERREVRGAYGGPAPPRHNPLSEPIRYVRCPMCNDLMNRKNFGRASGIIVDVCTRHGTWFDRGELPEVLDFAESGGLARARRTLDEERERSERMRHAMSVTHPLPLGGVSHAGTTVLDDVADAGISLLAFVRDLLQRR